MSNDLAGDSLVVYDMPDVIRQVVEPIVDEAAALLIRHTARRNDSIRPEDEHYSIDALVGRRYVSLNFSAAEREPFNERSQALPIDEIWNVEVDKNGARIEVGEGEERYTTGIPIEIAHAIMAAG